MRIGPRFDVNTDLAPHAPAPAGAGRQRARSGRVVIALSRAQVAGRHGRSAAIRVRRLLGPPDTIEVQRWLWVVPYPGAARWRRLARALTRAAAPCTLQAGCYPWDGSSTRRPGVRGEVRAPASPAARGAGGNRNKGARARWPGRVVPAYQPLFDLAHAHPVGAELLARAVLPSGRILTARDIWKQGLTPELEHEIDRMMLMYAMGRLGAARDDVKLLVNVSPSIWASAGAAAALMDEIAAPLHALGPAAERLTIEVTAPQMHGGRPLRRVLETFARGGCSLALCDADGDPRKLDWFPGLPLKCVKLGRGLTKRLQESRVRAIIRGVQRTAGALGVVTSAEGVEREHQANILREIGVDWGQGFYFSEAILDGEQAFSGIDAARPDRATISGSVGE